MITGWGAHHIDSAHWGMNTEYTGPIEVWGEAQFPDHGLWDVHGPFKTEALYANGVHMSVSGDYRQRHQVLRNQGMDLCFARQRAGHQERSRGQAERRDGAGLERSSIIKSVIGPDEIHLYESKEQHGNWLDCIISRKATDIAGGAGTSRLLHLPAFTIWPWC